MSPRNFHALFVLAPILLFLFTWAAYRLIPESSPVARGAAYVAFRTCNDCDAGSEGRLADTNYPECSNAYKIVGHKVLDAKCEDVMAYFAAVRVFQNFDERSKSAIGNSLIAGEHLARKYYCFQCHGQLGQGGFKNPKSLKGYVPGYFGRDFELLTRNADPDSVREWISHGLDSTILDEPLIGRIAEFFFRRQTVSMPSYKSLKPEEIEVLVNYVIALNTYGPMSAEAIRSYEKRTRLPNNTSVLINRNSPFVLQDKKSKVHRRR